MKEVEVVDDALVEVMKEGKEEEIDDDDVVAEAEAMLEDW